MPGTIWTSSQPSRPKLSRICLVAWTSTGAVRYSHLRHGPTVSRASPRDRARLTCARTSPRRARATSVGSTTWLNSTRLHVVTGKGGTGKTTVAAALALALAGRGPAGAAVRGRGAPGDRPALRRAAAAVRGAPDRRRSRRRRGVRARDRSRGGAAGVPRRCSTGSAAPAGRSTSSASSTSPRRSRPGVRDVLLTGKVYEAARRRTDDRSSTSSTTPWSWTRRRPAGSPASST